MTADTAQAQEAIRRCREFRDAGRPEAVLRSEIQSRLRLIFPSSEDESWINHYSAGAEAHTHIRMSTGANAGRFIDNLVGSTTIEYEADLRIQAKRVEGFTQVRDHAAGLIRSGVPVSQVRGILSDTLDWYAYDATLRPASLQPIAPRKTLRFFPSDELQLASEDAASAERLIAFIRKHLAREQSRPLRAELVDA